MATKEEIIERAKNSILNLKKDEAKVAAQEAIDAKIDLIEVIQDGFSAAMGEVGRKFEEGTLFIPHIILAAEIMNAGMDILKPELAKDANVEEDIAPVVVIGSILGDLHTIGKEIVATMLEVGGFRVIDLGKDVPLEAFIDTAKENNAAVIATSSLMTTTMIHQLQLEEMLKEEGLREGLITMVGGAPTSDAWAEKIGADYYAENAMAAVDKLKGLL
ncbi:MAG: B12-binding domain-containing protein [Methanosarcinaceae archaeon]|nr:B12-binding domain-containing protein [Methanosarcinaceae archaeon]